MGKQNAKFSCPRLPGEAYYENNTPLPGIWAHMVRMCTLWTDLKNHIYRYMIGDIPAPWSPDSEYSLINARLLHFESTFLDFYRYPLSKFSERSSDEIKEKRRFWLPWMNSQLTYHTYHAILNHPFLRAVTSSMSRFGQNVFWRTSSDLALLHATWISRLLRLCAERKLEVSDPFLAQPAAVAASLHLYYCQAGDDNVRSAAAENLSTCRLFIRKLAEHWPVCQSVVSHSANS